MRVAVVTLFPGLIGELASTSIVGRAVSSGKLSVHLEDLRRHGLGKHQSVDDTPYGGGAGMVLRVDCVVAAIEAAEASLAAPEAPRPSRVLMTPQGQRFDQRVAGELCSHGSMILICGRYEGFDERVRSHVDREVSLGDFVLAGGEIAAMAVIEACARLVPGVLGNVESTGVESFSPDTGGLLEFPQYTRPKTFRGQSVPEVLSSGHHEQVRRWRAERALERTLERRPDLVQRSGEATEAGPSKRKPSP